MYATYWHYFLISLRSFKIVFFPLCPSSRVGDFRQFRSTSKTAQIQKNRVFLGGTLLSFAVLDLHPPNEVPLRTRKNGLERTGEKKRGSRKYTVGIN